VPKWTSGSAVGDSSIFDNGTNVGIGVVPSSWSTVTPTLQIGAGGAFIGGQGSANVIRVGVNVYYDGSNWRYINSGTVSWFETASGSFGWFNSASGIAGNVASINQVMTLTASGNLGIGTTSPAYKLDVNGTGGFSGSVTSAGKITSGIGAFRTGGFYIPYAGNANSRTWAMTSDEIAYGDFSILTSSTQTGGIDLYRFYINPAGNVGIGTTNPTDKLTIQGTSLKFYTTQNVANQYTYIGTEYSAGNGNNKAEIRFAIDGTDTRTRMQFHTANGGGDIGERMRITYDGNVGIGTTAPTSKLQVAKGSQSNTVSIANSAAYIYGTDVGLAIGQDAGTGGYGTWLQSIRLSDGLSFSMALNPNGGNVGIGTLAPGYKLDVSGTIRATGDVIAYSDARVKENIETLDGALDKVMKMRGVSYNKIGEQDKKVGVIAQEILEVLPEVVSQDETGTYSVAYGNIVSVLIEAIKEQQKQIDELKSKLK
jgi:hypothetical protein